MFRLYEQLQYRKHHLILLTIWNLSYCQESDINVLNVDFDDITDSVLETKYGRALGITIEQAQQIVDFIIDRYSKGVENWYLHCRAGRSRSAACGQFLIGFLKQYTDDVNDNGFLKDKINTFVWNKLLEAYNVSCT